MNSGRILPTEIEAPGRWPRLRLGELWRYRSIGWVLVLRNLKVRYRQTMLGVAWVLLQPLLYMLVLSIVFTIVRPPQFGIPAPIFVLSALIMFLPINKILAEGTTSIVRNAPLVNQIYVPRALIPLSVAAGALVDLGLMLLLYEVMLLLFGYLPDARYLLLPLLIAIAWACGIGLAYWFSAANTRYRDLQLLVPFVTQMWFWLSPIIYPAQSVPERFLPLYYLNPMSLVITATRWAITDAPAPPDYAYVLATISSLVLLVSGYVFFKSQEPTFADDL